MKNNNYLTTLSCIFVLQLFCASAISYGMEASEEQSEETEELTQEQKQRLEELETAQYILANLPNSYLSNSLLFEIIGYLPPLTRARLLLNTHMSGAFGSKKKNPRAEMEKQLEKLTLGNTLGNKLFGAIDDCNLEAVKQLIEAGADLNMQNEDGLTPLMYVVSYPYDLGSNPHRRLSLKEICKALIKAGAELNLQNQDGKTALMHACQSYLGDSKITNEPWHANILDILLQSGADPNIQDAEGQTILMSVIETAVYRSIPIALKILQAGAHLDMAKKNGQTVVDIAKEKNPFAHELFQLLEQIRNRVTNATLGTADRDEVINEITTLAKRHAPPLIFLIKTGQYDLAKTLINWNWNLKERSEENKTPLIWAIGTGNLELVRILLEAGASCDSTSGRNILLKTVSDLPLPLITLLLKHKENLGGIQTFNSVAQRIGILAAHDSDAFELLKLFITHGADIPTLLVIIKSMPSYNEQTKLVEMYLEQKLAEQNQNRTHENQ